MTGHPVTGPPETDLAAGARPSNASDEAGDARSVHGDSATALAHPNIALIKYWGKRDERLALPATSSLSLTLDLAATSTTVTLVPDSSAGESGGHDAVGPGTDSRDTVGSEARAHDTVGSGARTHDTVGSGARTCDTVRWATPQGALIEMSPGEARRVSAFLDLVRARAGRHEAAIVTTRNEIPTGAGLASSASGFAALALAAAAAYGLDLDRRELSRLARRGSGSASRSIFGGLVVWYAGDTDADSYAEPIDDGGLDLALVVVVLTSDRKAVGSREAMRRTVSTSPFFDAWVHSVPDELARMRRAIDRGDFTEVGVLAEANALRMHATMLGARPPVRYWTPATVAALDVVADLRRSGVECYATIDAGPNVKVLSRAPDVAAVAQRFAAELALSPAERATRLLEARPGVGARLVRAGA